MVNDPIADMLTRIRNASMVKQKQVVMPTSKIKVSIAKILQEEGFIEAFAVIGGQAASEAGAPSQVHPQGRPVITGLERVSKPGRRYYSGAKDIPWVRSGLGINIVSTPKGLMTGRKARRDELGGEILCNVW